MNSTMIILLIVGIAVVVPLGILISWLDSRRYKNTSIQKEEQNEQNEQEKKNEKNEKNKKK